MITYANYDGGGGFFQLTLQSRSKTLSDAENDVYAYVAGFSRQQQVSDSEITTSYLGERPHAQRGQYVYTFLVFITPKQAVV